jgi:hypothetical protein
MKHTAYHIHNFFSRKDAIQFKYNTYGHPIKDIYDEKKYMNIENIHGDIALMVYCARDVLDPITDRYKRVMGGYEELHNDFKPIYFRDSDYRRRRQDLVRQIVGSVIISPISSNTTTTQQQLEDNKSETNKQSTSHQATASPTATAPAAPLTAPLTATVEIKMKKKKKKMKKSNN